MTFFDGTQFSGRGEDSTLHWKTEKASDATRRCELIFWTKIIMKITIDEHILERSTHSTLHWQT